MNRSLPIALCFLVVALALSPFSLGQGIVTGSISGTVEDPQGAVISDASVVAIHLGTNREYQTRSTSAGLVSLRGLPPGTYKIRVEAANFRAFENNGVNVEVGADSSLGVMMLDRG